MPCYVEIKRHSAPSVVNKVQRLVKRFNTLDGLKAELERHFSSKQYHVYQGDNHIALMSKRGKLPAEDRRRNILIITDGIEI